VEETVVHAQRNLVILFYRHGLLFLHHFLFTVLFLLAVPQETSVHTLLLSGCILHGLKVFLKGRGASSGSGSFKAYILDIVGRYVGKQLNLLLQFTGKVIFLIV
jgi:hypothetical protein